MIQEAVLFDMDGVIVNTHHSVTTFWQQLAQEQNIEITHEDFAQHIYGCTAEHTLTNVFTHLNTQERQELLHDIRRRNTPDTTYEEISGVTALIRSLADHNIPVAIVTSGTRQRMPVALKSLGIAHCVSAIVTAEDITRGKPDPACYELAAQKLHVPPERCIVFEDALSGVRAAVAAGALCVGVHSPYHPVPLKEVGAHTVIPDFTVITSTSDEPDTLTLHIDGDPAVKLTLRHGMPSFS